MRIKYNIFLKEVNRERPRVFHFRHLLIMSLLIMSFLSNKSFAQCTELVWYDEFDGTTLDQSKWSYALGRGCDQPSGCGFGNGEEQSYTNSPNNISVGGGNLTITAIANNPEPGAAFSSAKIQSLGKQSFRYGKIEARMKLPSGQGAWPAFWMLPETNNWPYTGEIDIMEAKHKNPTQLLGTVFHYNGHNTGQVTTPDLSAAFHKYAVEWENNEIRWYFDDVLYHRANPSTTGGAWPFNDVNPFFLIFNVAVGGLGTPFTGNTAFNTADFPTSLQVDYIHVYKGRWNVEFLGDPFVYKNENNKIYSVTAVSGGTYNWTVPSGATVASGQGTNQISVNFGSNAVSGNIVAAITSGCTTQNYTKAITVEPAFKVTTQLKDWDANSNMTFKSASGTLTQVVNPSGTGNVGKYVRKASELYDNFIYNNIALGNASDFVTRRRRIHADIYTNAPVGTKLRIQLENAVKSAQAFPVGRHSVHEVKTTKQNQWETVEFEYVNSPDLGTTSFTVDQIAFLFAVETNDGSTYHIDNIQIGTAGDLCPRVVNQTLEDFQTNRNITFNSSTGTLSTVANPSATGVNTSAQVGKYIRNSAELYDVLFYKNVSINNLANFKTGKSVFKMQVNSNAPVGTVISLQLETSASIPTNYPTGRHSLYQGVTSVQNQWEVIEFSYITALDALAADADVNSLVFLFNPNSATNSTYYFDNVLTEAENCGVVIVDTQAPSVPTNLAGTVTNTTINLTWTASTDNSGTVAGYEVYVNSETTPRATVTATSAAISGLVAGNTYSFKVRAKDAVPNYSAFSNSINVTTTNSPVTLPSPWATADIGAVGIAGSASHNNGTFTVVGSGADIWDVNDEFRYVYQPITGDVTITARVVTIGNTDGWAKAGVMIREGVAANAIHVYTAVSFSNGVEFQRRTATGAASTNNAGATGAAPYWVRLVRAGNVFSSFMSGNGTTWTQIGANLTLAMASQTQVGLALTSHNDGVLNTSTFDNVTVTTTSNVAVTGVTISPASATLSVGATQQLTGTIAPANATNQNKTWSSNNTVVATVNGSGLVTGVSAGSATITVTTQDGAKTASSSFTITATDQDITNLGGTMSSQYTDSPAAEAHGNLIDNNSNTKYLTFHNASWVQYQATGNYVVSRYTITSANDAAERDPLTWTLQGSGNGTTWTTIDTRTGEDFATRLLKRSFTFTNSTGYTYYRFNLTNNSGTILQLAEIELFGTPANTSGVCSGTVANGDYTYQVSTTADNVNWTFIPGSPIAGSTLCLLYIKVGTSAYVGYTMTASGSNFVFSQAQATGTAISFYFTYRIGATMSERSSVATPHAYTAGTACSASARSSQPIGEEGIDSYVVYPNPVEHTLTIKGAQGGSIGIINIQGVEVAKGFMNTDDKDVSELPSGVYNVILIMNNKRIIKRFVKK